MHLIVTTVFSLLFLCCLWTVETREFASVIGVLNGGKWGEWGNEEFCTKGYIDGFSVKMEEKPGIILDKKGLIGIRAYCSDGSVITSSVGKGGKWTGEKSCSNGYPRAFALRVAEPQGPVYDDTAVNNIKFLCPGDVELEGDGPALGEYRLYSETCGKGAMCGIVTKVEKPTLKNALDRTELNDVAFFCCN